MPLTLRTRVADGVTAPLLVAVRTGCDSSERLSAFTNPVMEGLWSIRRMAQARSADTGVPNGIGEDSGTTDPESGPVPAQQHKATYHATGLLRGRLVRPQPGRRVGAW
jgi:hypothetical protein